MACDVIIADVFSNNQKYMFSYYFWFTFCDCETLGNVVKLSISVSVSILLICKLFVRILSSVDIWLVDYKEKKQGNFEIN